MGFKISYQWPASLKGKGKIAKIEKAKPEILAEAGRELFELICDWLRDIDSRGNRLGGKRTNHFSPNHVKEPIVDGNFVSVPIHIAGITRAFHDIVIAPKEARAIAIPLHASAYGIAPREWNKNHPKGTKDALFKPKGKDYLARNDDGKLVVMYLLRNTVRQPQNAALLPSKEKMYEVVNESVWDAIRAILGH